MLLSPVWSAFNKLCTRSFNAAVAKSFCQLQHPRNMLHMRLRRRALYDRCCTTRQTACNKTTDSLYIQMYFSASCTRACKARVRFSERSFPPGYGYDSCTVLATLLIPTGKRGHALCSTSPLCPIKITVPIKCAFGVSIFRSVNFYPNPTPPPLHFP